VKEFVMSEDPIVTKPLSDAPAHNRWMMKDGEFTKTGGLLVIGGFAVIFVYLVTSMFNGTHIDVGNFHWVVPVFASVDAGILLSILGGTYVANHKLPSKE